MGYKEEAKLIVEELNARYPHKLKCGEDLLRVIEISLQFEMNDKLDSLAFEGKFADGILNIIRKGGASLEEDYFAKIKKEYTESLEKVKNGMSEIIGKSSDFLKEIFERKYFQLTQESLLNLSNFCSDLNYLKLYLNDKKRN